MPSYANHSLTVSSQRMYALGESPRLTMIAALSEGVPVTLALRITLLPPTNNWSVVII